jgi:methylglyoxal synthase
MTARSEKVSPPDPKTLIGVLASRDSKDKNKALKDVFHRAHDDSSLKARLSDFRFVFTGGTYERLFKGQACKGQDPSDVKHKLRDDVADFLFGSCGVIRLQAANKGGVTTLGSLVTQRKVSVLWPFFSSLTTHVLFPENLALLRLGDQWRVKKLMNSGSVEEWLKCEADRDMHLNIQPWDFAVDFPSGAKLQPQMSEGRREMVFREVNDKISRPQLDDPTCSPEKLSDDVLQHMTIALISHDEMKTRMVDFVIDYEHELIKFKNILATGTTGKLVSEVAPSLASKVCRYHSGPKGGDIEIATEILFDGCDIVIFFVDPLSAHPHMEDIRVVFGACMVQDRVRMLSNEVQARAWMDRRVRGT